MHAKKTIKWWCVDGMKAQVCLDRTQVLDHRPLELSAVASHSSCMMDGLGQALGGHVGNQLARGARKGLSAASVPQQHLATSPGAQLRTQAAAVQAPASEQPQPQQPGQYGQPAPEPQYQSPRLFTNLELYRQNDAMTLSVRHCYWGGCCLGLEAHSHHLYLVASLPATPAPLQAIPPSLKPTGNAAGDWKLEKAGSVLLTFAKGLGVSGRPQAGQARFDWQNKQVNYARNPALSSCSKWEGC